LSEDHSPPPISELSAILPPSVVKETTPLHVDIDPLQHETMTPYVPYPPAGAFFHMYAPQPTDGLPVWPFHPEDD